MTTVILAYCKCDFHNATVTATATVPVIYAVTAVSIHL